MGQQLSVTQEESAAAAQLACPRLLSARDIKNVHRYRRCAEEVDRITCKPFQRQAKWSITGLLSMAGRFRSNTYYTRYLYSPDWLIA